MTGTVDLKWSRNSFTNDYAYQGGNIYLHNVYQTMDSLNYLEFESHSHKATTAKSQGGGIYYAEDLQEVRLKLSELASPIVPSSEYSTLATNSGEGGVFYISATKYIDI